MRLRHAMTLCYLTSMFRLVALFLMLSLNAAAADFCTRTEAGISLDFNALVDSAYSNPKLSKDYTKESLTNLFSRVSALAESDADFKQQLIAEWCGDKSVEVFVDDIFITDWHHNFSQDGVESFSSQIHIKAFIPKLARTSDGVFKNYQSYFHDTRGKRQISDTFTLVEFKR